MNLLAMLDSLFVETEKIIMRKTYSDEGFRIIVNGVTVHKTTVCIKLNIQRSSFKKTLYPQMPWDNANSWDGREGIMRLVRNYTNAHNSGCDVEMDSYDAVLFLTSRDENSNLMHVGEINCQYSVHCVEQVAIYFYSQVKVHYQDKLRYQEFATCA